MRLPPVWRGLLELLAPSRCPGCDHAHPGPHPFCGACAPLLEPAPTRGRQWGAWRFEGPLADAVHRYKYRGRTDLADGLSGLLWEALARHTPDVDLVTAVPLHPRRLRERGYNQSGLLAAGVARRMGRPLALGALARLRDTDSQVGHSRAQRAEQVRGAFGASRRVRSQRVLLIDDVRTSGATLSEATRALGEEGAAAVWAVALAQAELGGTTAL